MVTQSTEYTTGISTNIWQVGGNAVWPVDRVHWVCTQNPLNPAINSWTGLGLKKHGFLLPHFSKLEF
ncbi:hypothetical protein AAC387_Pa08g2657 [Persea americana]